MNKRRCRRNWSWPSLRYCPGVTGGNYERSHNFLFISHKFSLIDERIYEYVCLLALLSSFTVDFNLFRVFKAYLFDPEDGGDVLRNVG
jgi:hypothetical protein